MSSNGFEELIDEALRHLDRDGRFGQAFARPFRSGFTSSLEDIGDFAQALVHTFVLVEASDAVGRPLVNLPLPEATDTERGTAVHFHVSFNPQDADQVRNALTPSPWGIARANQTSDGFADDQWLAMGSVQAIGENLKQQVQALFVESAIRHVVAGNTQTVGPITMKELVKGNAVHALVDTYMAATGLDRECLAWLADYDTCEALNAVGVPFHHPSALENPLLADIPVALCPCGLNAASTGYLLLGPWRYGYTVPLNPEPITFQATAYQHPHAGTTTVRLEGTLYLADDLVRDPSEVLWVNVRRQLRDKGD